MKKLTTLFLTTLIGVSVWGQSVNIPDKNGSTTPINHINGNVGIGSSDPISKLNVWTYANALDWNTTISNEYHTQTGRPGVGLKFKLGYKTETSKWAGIAAISAVDWENCIDLAFYTKYIGAPSERIRIRYDGNVGIGTASPTAKLDVKGTIKADRVSMFNWYNPNCGHTNSSLVMNGVRVNNEWKLHGDGARSSIGVVNTDIFGNIKFLSHHDDQFTSGKTISDEEFINNNTKMVIKINGNIGIGTITPDYKLDVCGTIRAKEVKVEEFTCSNASFNGTLAANQITVTTNGQTADFVFEEDYELRDLQEVETFIKSNKHLPDIPSAAAMEADGVNLAEMNKLLLLKIEELTLYAIDKENRIQELEDEGAKHKAEVKELKETHRNTVDRLAKIEAMLMEK